MHNKARLNEFFVGLPLLWINDNKFNIENGLSDEFSRTRKSEVHSFLDSVTTLGRVIKMVLRHYSSWL